jgi:hypothetical protein
MQSATKTTGHFARHYVEMVLAMFLGMAVVGLPAAAALGALGISTAELRNEAPALLLLRMGLVMTIPMVAWMRYRGHGWPASADMAASMLLPTFGAMALIWTGVVADVGTLLVAEHLVMLPSMLVAMLLRRDQYTGAAHRARAAGTGGDAVVLA